MGVIVVREPARRFERGDQPGEPGAASDIAGIGEQVNLAHRPEPGRTFDRKRCFDQFLVLAAADRLLPPFEPDQIGARRRRNGSRNRTDCRREPIVGQGRTAGLAHLQPFTLAAKLLGDRNIIAHSAQVIGPRPQSEIVGCQGRRSGGKPEPVVGRSGGHQQVGHGAPFVVLIDQLGIVLVGIEQDAALGVEYTRVTLGGSVAIAGDVD